MEAKVIQTLTNLTSFAQKGHSTNEKIPFLPYQTRRFHTHRCWRTLFAPDMVESGLDT